MTDELTDRNYYFSKIEEYEECSECGHSTEYIIDGKDEADCSECVAEKSHCNGHGNCTKDPDICECCGQEVLQ
jgi:hypothetical protein